MKASLVDTNILSMFFRGHPQVVVKFQAYLAEYDTINLSMITYYEIVSGLRHRDAQPPGMPSLEGASPPSELNLKEQQRDQFARLASQVLFSMFSR